MGTKIDLPQSTKVEILDETEAIERLRTLIQFGQGGYSIAVNAEKIIRLSSDPDFRGVFEQASILICDGVGLNIFSRKNFKKVNWPHVAACVAAENKWRCAVIGGSEEINLRASQNMREMFGLNVVKSVDGFRSVEHYFEIIRESSSNLVFLGLGSPKQEILAKRLFQEFPDKFFINCGGALDIFAGTKKRAPAFIVNSNFEWLYRFFQQPSRFWRYIKIIRIFFIK